jgi:HK97 family phage major capsid protein
MDRRQALAALQKATIDTTVAADALLDPERSNRFVRQIKENGVLLQAMRLERRTASSGSIDKIATGRRIIRRATENADDGYRAGVGFAAVGYQTVKLRLPWEVTEDVFHENIEGAGFEATIVDQMTEQFALDLEDLAINGDTAAGAGADQAFLTINDGILKQLATAPVAGRTIDGSTINGGAIAKDHFFEALYAMPNVYRNSGRLRWMMSPARAISWWESLTARTTAAGDALLNSRADQAGARGPLGIPIMEIPAMPDSSIVFGDPQNFVQVVTWDIRRRKVTGETDMELAAKDKRFYVFFLKNDVIIEEKDAIVVVNGLDPVT